MKKILCIAVALFALTPATVAFSPDELKKMPAARMLFTQTLTAPDGSITGSAAGTLEVQYPCFSIVMGDIRIFGNDKTVWLRDLKNDEVIISGSILTQLLSESDIRSKGGMTTIVWTAADGTRHEYILTVAEQMQHRWDESHFTLDESTLGENTIITDMR